MKTLIVNKDTSLEVKEIPKPNYSEKQALVKMISSGICGTDAKLLHGKFKGFPIEGYPLMLGHEGVGEVIELGADVTSFKVGDKVLLPFVDPDPELYGELGSAWGAFSEYGIIHDPAAYDDGQAPDCAYAQTVVPSDIDPVDAAMIITFREVLSNIRYFGIKEEDSIVVFGCGPVGLTFIKFLSLLGIKQIIAVDTLSEKKTLALKQGAHYAFISSECNITKEVRKICPNGVSYVLDAVGIPAIINQAMELICDRGEILCYGVPPTEELHIDFSKADYNWKLNYQQMPRKIDEGKATGQILTWLRNGDIKFEDYISDYFKFEDILTAFKKFENKEILKKAIITY